MADNSTASFLGRPSGWHSIRVSLSEASGRQLILRGTGEVEVVGRGSAHVPIAQVHRVVSLLVAGDLAAVTVPAPAPGQAHDTLEVSNGEGRSLRHVRGVGAPFPPFDQVQAELSALMDELFPPERGFFARLFGRGNR